MNLRDAWIAADDAYWAARRAHDDAREALDRAYRDPHGEIDALGRALDAAAKAQDIAWNARTTAKHAYQQTACTPLGDLP